MCVCVEKKMSGNAKRGRTVDPKKIQEYPGNKRDISGIEYPERRGNDENLSPHTFSVTSPHKKKNLGIQRLSSLAEFHT